MSIKFDVATQNKKEHEILRRDLDRISASLNMASKKSDMSEWKLEFVWWLRDFRNHLLKHADLEEDGSFIEEIINRAPELLNTAKRFEAEHEQTIAFLDDLLSELKSAGKANDLSLSDFQPKLTALVSQIENHESVENELIKKVFYQEFDYPSS